MNATILDIRNGNPNVRGVVILTQNYSTNFLLEFMCAARIAAWFRLIHYLVRFNYVIGQNIGQSSTTKVKPKSPSIILLLSSKLHLLLIYHGLSRYYQTGRTIDIGCGIGGFVHAAQSAGWDSYGVGGCQ